MKALPITDSDFEKRTFFRELTRKFSKDGIVSILRNGLRYSTDKLDMYYSTLSEQNDKAVALYGQNIFSMMRQLRYSNDFPKLVLDLGVFIKGLPVMTFRR